MARLVERGDRDARVRVEVTPGERFGHLIKTLYGLARLGHTDSGYAESVAARNRRT